MRKRQFGNSTLLSFVFAALIWPGLSPLAVETAAPVPEEAVNIAVDDKPLAMPEEFKKSLAAMGVTRLSMVDGQGRLKVFALDGTPVDLCGPKPEGSTGPRTCTLAASAKELTLRLTAASECGGCFDGFGNLRSCYKPTSKYTCTTRDRICASTCN